MVKPTIINREIATLLLAGFLVAMPGTFPAAMRMHSAQQLPPWPTWSEQSRGWSGQLMDGQPTVPVLIPNPVCVPQSV